ncbi:hypothetical protein GIB67_014857 [Kingdonia uniflora]|uniref:Calcium-transporting ATPase n=1 Tax=Kingdonia uniflora TaxID=39325 RepID=A0A7J7MT74_9MAGN|nr:hypothetical protein GIB67_014857 [Kingdonia uniflora]
MRISDKLFGPKQRWRLAFSVISICNALISLTKKKLLPAIQRTPSYKVIDIHADDEVNESDQNHIPFYKIDPKSLVNVVKERSLELLGQLGGVEGVVALVETDAENGIVDGVKNLSCRRNVFGANTYPKKPPKGFFYFMVEAFKDTTILILLVCAALSLGFGINKAGWANGWYDGGSIYIAVFLVIGVSAVSNFKQSRQFEKLSKESANIKVDVVRDGRRQEVSTFDIVVGDIVCLKIGDQIPADGLFLSGYSLTVDESSITGEGDHLDVNWSENPFLFSGAKVVDGYVQMLVTSVGMNTTWGEVMGSINRDTNEQTPLQARLDKLTSYIGKIGLTVAFFVLVVLLVRYFTGTSKDAEGHREYLGRETKFRDVMNAVILIISDAVTIVVVAIPEGLPLAVTLTLAFSMKRMMSDMAMVRKLSACETMGSATIICTDKTGTLTLNQMKVTEFWLGQNAINNDSLHKISLNVLELLRQGVSLNTTGNVYRANSGMAAEFCGSPTEKALLSWAVFDLGMNMEELKRDCSILHVETFNSEKKRSGISMRKKDDEKTIYVHWKGAAEMIVSMCSSYQDQTGVINSIDEAEKVIFNQIIQGMAAKSLRCIAFAYGKVVEGEFGYSDPQLLKEEGLVLFGVVGLKDPCRPEVKSAVEACRGAGVKIKMITGDNLFTARAIAIECGILSEEVGFDNGEVVEGAEFRNYTPEERAEKVNIICVMARSSPLDKLLMVQCLKQIGHVVAVTGDGTNDAPALKEADIGLSMGIQGTEVAKESSDIIILDDNFTSIVTVLKWGRCVYNNIQKFIQFQLTVNIAALVINLIAAVSAGEIPLTAVQMLWVNLIMDTLGALALATERPTEDLMEKPPVGRSKPLITNIMWRNLISQALYQVAVLLTLQFKGEAIFGVNEKVKDTLLFNTFVFCQVFNEFNSRKLEKKNVFEGILRNKLFMGIIGVTVVLQVVMVEFLKKFAGTHRLNWGQWGACIGVAAISWPLGWVVKCIPVSN